MRRTVLIIKEHAAMNPNKEQARMWWIKSLWDSGSKATAKTIRDRGHFLHNPLQQLFQTACVLRHRLYELNRGLCEEDPWNASGSLKCHPVITKTFFGIILGWYVLLLHQLTGLWMFMSRKQHVSSVSRLVLRVQQIVSAWCHRVWGGNNFCWCGI